MNKDTPSTQCQNKLSQKKAAAYKHKGKKKRGGSGPGGCRCQNCSMLNNVRYNNNVPLNIIQNMGASVSVQMAAPTPQPPQRNIIRKQIFCLCHIRQLINL